MPGESSPLGLDPIGRPSRASGAANGNAALSALPATGGEGLSNGCAEAPAALANG
jgi:hypothetical protein